VASESGRGSLRRGSGGGSWARGAQDAEPPFFPLHRNAASQIQRTFRGYLGRNKSSAELQKKLRHERMAVYHYHSIFIQKSFRGFYSRRYYHDFFARKHYIQSIMAKSNALRDKLEANLLQQQQVVFVHCSPIGLAAH
jgi:hypothetical protein